MSGIVIAILLIASACTQQDPIAGKDMDWATGSFAGHAAAGDGNAGAVSGGRGGGSAGQPAAGAGGYAGEQGGAVEDGAGSGAGGTSAGSAGNSAGGSAAGAGGTGDLGDAGDTAVADAGADADGSSPPLPDYTLMLDAPGEGDTVAGEVTVNGRAPGFLNVEVWDSQHQNPPLGQATVAGDGTYTMSIDVSALALGATTWTIHAWDSPPGQAFENTTSVTVELTIGSDSCSGQSCSGHGGCVVTGDWATCDCDEDYRAVGLTCVPDQTRGDGHPDPGTTYVPSGYQLVFSDEFDGGALDTVKWNTLAPYGVQWYSDSDQKQAFIPEAVSLNNGVVTFTAQPSDGSNTSGQPYGSGGLTSNGTFTHGYFEARVRVPAGKGLWPAFWLTSSTRWPPG